jgi:hypothetical protein
MDAFMRSSRPGSTHEELCYLEVWDAMKIALPDNYASLIATARLFVWVCTVFRAL